MSPDERALMHAQERHDAELEAEMKAEEERVDRELAALAEDMQVADDEGVWWTA